MRTMVAGKGRTVASMHSLLSSTSFLVFSTLRVRECVLIFVAGNDAFNHRARRAPARQSPAITSTEGRPKPRASDAR
jgi:hypothetical protein